MPLVKVVTVLEIVVGGREYELLSLEQVPCTSTTSSAAPASCQAALKYTDTSNLGEKGFIWLSIPGYIPSWQGNVVEGG